MTSPLAWYLDRSPKWMQEGACVIDVDPDLFFPATEADPRIPKARAVCDECSVSADCLQYAMDTFQSGIWGGLTEWERRELREQLRDS